MSGYDPQYTSPRGPGRPPQESDIPIVIDNFGQGVDLYNDSMVSNINTYYSWNTRAYSGRTLDRRKGYTLHGTTGSSGKCYMLGTIEKLSGTDVFLRLIDGAGAGVQTQYYDTTALAWTNLGSNIGTSSDRIDWFSASTVVSGTEYAYYTDGVVDVQYTDGATVSTISNVRGKYITRIENILVLGCLTLTFSRNQFVYSKAGTNQFYKDSDASYAASTNVVDVDGDITQLATFGSHVYVFTRNDGLFKVDASANIWIPRKISTHGTPAPKSVAVGYDTMFWADEFGVWALTSDSETPTRISDIVQRMYKSSLLLT
jgi:hypothetical protein